MRGGSRISGEWHFTFKFTVIFKDVFSNFKILQSISTLSGQVNPLGSMPGNTFLLNNVKPRY
jgi:hypothetical protein